MKCSLYVPVFNERDALERTLRSLIPEKEGHEVFVVDFGSEDGSVEVAEAHKWVKVISCSEAVLAVGLNEAVEAEGDGEVVLFLQPGALPVRGWSEAVAAHFNGENDAGHFGLAEAEPTSKPAAALRRLALKIGQQLIGGSVGLTGLAVTRETFREVGGFAPVPDFEWLAFAARVREAGGKVSAIPHEIQLAPRPGSRQANAWEELFEDLQAARRYRKSESFDPVRCRRRTTAAILLGYDVFEGEEGSDYFEYARDELLGFNLEVLQSYRGVRRVVYAGGKDTTKWLGQPSGVKVCPHIRTELSKRLGKLLSELEEVGTDGVLVVRGDCKNLTHRRLRQVSEGEEGAPCRVLPDEGGKEWLALWIDAAALPLFRGWDAGLGIEPLKKRFFYEAVELEVLEPCGSRLRTDHDARAMYYAGVVDRLPGKPKVIRHA